MIGKETGIIRVVASRQSRFIKARGPPTDNAKLGSAILDATSTECNKDPAESFDFSHHRELQAERCVRRPFRKHPPRMAPSATYSRRGSLGDERAGGAVRSLPLPWPGQSSSQTAAGPASRKIPIRKAAWTSCARPNAPMTAPTGMPNAPPATPKHSNPIQLPPTAPTITPTQELASKTFILDHLPADAPRFTEPRRTTSVFIPRTARPAVLMARGGVARGIVRILTNPATGGIRR